MLKEFRTSLSWSSGSFAGEKGNAVGWGSFWKNLSSLLGLSFSELLISLIGEFRPDHSAGEKNTFMSIHHCDRVRDTVLRG